MIEDIAEKGYNMIIVNDGSSDPGISFVFIIVWTVSGGNTVSQYRVLMVWFLPGTLRESRNRQYRNEKQC